MRGNQSFITTMKRHAETPASSSNFKMSRREDWKYSHTDQRTMIVSSSDSSYVTISDSESDSEDSENDVIIIPNLETDVLPVIPNGHSRPITPLSQEQNPFAQHNHATGLTGNNTDFACSNYNCIDIDHHQQQPNSQSSKLQLGTIDQSLADCSSLLTTNTSPMNMFKSSTNVASLPFGTADELFQSAETVLKIMQQDLDTFNSAAALDDMEKIKKESRTTNVSICLNTQKTRERKKLSRNIVKIENALTYLRKHASKMISSVSTASLDGDSKERFEQMYQHYYSEKSHLLKQLSVVASQIESARENLSKSQDKPLHRNICNQQVTIFLRTEKQIKNSLRDIEISFQTALGNFSDMLKIDAFCDLKTISETVQSWRSASLPPDKSHENKKHEQKITMKKVCDNKFTDIDRLAKARKVQKQLEHSYFMLKPLAQILLCRQQKRKALRVSQQKEVISNGLQTCQQPWKLISQCNSTVAYSAGISSICQSRGADQWQVLKSGDGFEATVQKLKLTSPHTSTLTPNENLMVADGPVAPEYGDSRDVKQKYDNKICHFVADLADFLQVTSEQRENARYTRKMNSIRNFIRNFITKYKQKQLYQQM